MLNIGLIFHSTVSDNMGVGALTVAQIGILRRLAADIGTQIKITVIDWHDPRKPYVSGPDVEIIRIRARDILKPWVYARIIARMDMVIDIGAGDSFADIYGKARLQRLFAMKFIAHALGRPFVLAPQTIGPFTKPLSRRLAGLSLRLSRIVASRDRMSTTAAQDLGRRDVIEASDVALRLPYDSPGPRAPGPVRVGINVSGLLMAGGYTKKNMFGLTLDYPALMRTIIADFRARPEGCEVHLVAHVITGRGDVEDDLAACTALAAEFPGTIVAPAFTSPSQAKSYIAGLDFFMGARMHACIAAFSSGVPVVPMAYSRKFAGLFGSIGYDRTVDCTASDAETIRQAIQAAYDSRDVLQAEAKAALIEGLARLDRYEAALRDLMQTRQRH